MLVSATVAVGSFAFASDASVLEASGVFKTAAAAAVVVVVVVVVLLPSLPADA